jgi:hypothetical protein
MSGFFFFGVGGGWCVVGGGWVRFEQHLEENSAIFNFPKTRFLGGRFEHNFLTRFTIEKSVFRLVLNTEIAVKMVPSNTFIRVIKERLTDNPWKSKNLRVLVRVLGFPSFKRLCVWFDKPFQPAKSSPKQKRIR